MRGTNRPFAIKNDPKVIWRTLRYVLTTLILIVCVVFSAYQIIKWYAENDIADEQIAALQADTAITSLADNSNTDIISDERPANDPYWQLIKAPMIDADLAKSLSINPSTIGWIEVPGTKINYPFVQANDNNFYLTHSFDRSWSSAGWVFLDYRNDKNLNDKNQILYAHGRVDGSMFGSLATTLTDTWQSNTTNHVVKISTPTESTLWQVFSTYQIPVTSDYLTTNFTNADDFAEFIKLITNRSNYDYHTKVSLADRIITLSTCVGTRDRAVLHAKLIKLTKKS